MADAPRPVESEKEPRQRMGLQLDALDRDNQRRHRSGRSASHPVGIQLLSPTLAASIRSQRATSKPEPGLRAKRVGWSDSHVQWSTAKQRVRSERLGLDGLTPAAERTRLAASLGHGEHFAGCSRSVGKPRASSNASFRPEPSVPVLGGSFDEEELAILAPAALDAQYQQLQQRRQAGDKQSQQRTPRRRNDSGRLATASSPSGRSDATAPDLLSLASTRFPADLNALAGENGPAPVPRRRAVLSGWLERRQRLVLTRWCARFCVLKADGSLYLYRSEDTVNGRLERRLTVLRVLLARASDAFGVIAVDACGAARREELRATAAGDWDRWFCALRRFLDERSLHEALRRRPELLLLSPLSRAPSALLDASVAGSDWRWREDRERTRDEVESGRDRRSSGDSGHYEAARVAERRPDGLRVARPPTPRPCVQPMPAEHAVIPSGQSRRKPRSRSTAEGLGRRKTHERATAREPAEELRPAAMVTDWWAGGLEAGRQHSPNGRSLAGVGDKARSSSLESYSAIGWDCRLHEAA